MLVRRRRRNHLTTDSFHTFRKYPNLLKGMRVMRPEQVLVGDVTYVSVRSGFAYLSLLMDAYSHRIMGYHLHPTLHAQGCLQALHMALTSRRYPNRVLTHHTDRASQYCCNQYVSALKRHRIRISMTQAGDPSENPMAERLNGILKYELSMNAHFTDFAQAQKTLQQAVLIYNHHRMHATCDYLTPEQAHTRTGQLNRRWKRYPRMYRAKHPPPVKT
jgi:transposase InsO family protein